MTYYARGGILRAPSLVNAWEKVPQEIKDILKIELGEHTITAKEQFETFWLDVPLIYLESQLEHAERMFLMILSENKLLIEKVRNQSKVVKELSNLDNWRETKTITSESKSQSNTAATNQNKLNANIQSTGKNESSDEKKSDTKTDALTKSGNSDENSYSDEFTTMLEETDVSDMPINAMAQGRNIAAVTVADTNTTLLNSKNEIAQLSTSDTNAAATVDGHAELDSSTFTFHKAKEYRSFLRLELATDFRLKLWGQFRKIFLNA